MSQYRVESLNRYIKLECRGTKEPQAENGKMLRVIALALTGEWPVKLWTKQVWTVRKTVMGVSEGIVCVHNQLYRWSEGKLSQVRTGGKAPSDQSLIVAYM